MPTSAGFAARSHAQHPTKVHDARLAGWHRLSAAEPRGKRVMF